MQGFVYLNGTKYPVFVDMLTANFESDCTATIQAADAVDGWIQASNGVDYNTVCKYIDYNGKFKLKCRFRNGEPGNWHVMEADALKA